MQPSQIKTRRGRFEFLDALRGIGALAVVLQHAGEYIWPSYTRWSIEVFRPGEFGVVLFFLVSGFIIPASTERYASVRRFWVGRFFRLYPIYWVFVLAAVAMHHFFGRYHLPDAVTAEPVAQVLVNLTMVQEFLGSFDSMIIGSSWTLAYEMCFYIFVSLLFISRLQRRSVPLAVGGLCLAGAVGTYVPGLLVSDSDAQSLLTVGCLTLLAVLFFASRGEGTPAKALAVAMSAILVPLVLNQADNAWFTMLLFSTMFVGTVLYRVVTGEVDARLGWAVWALGLAAVFVLNKLYVPDRATGIAGAVQTWRPEALTFAAAYLLFGAAVLLRRFGWPRPLLFLGRISYSLYLVHPLVLEGVPRWSASAASPLGIPRQWLTYLTWVVVAIAVSIVTYYVIERPFHRLGQRLGKRARGSARVSPST